MKHFVIFFGPSSKRMITAATFGSMKAAEKHAKNWCPDGDYSIGEVRIVKRSKRRKPCQLK